MASAETPGGVQYPPGTPEYEAYAAKLRAELAKFRAGTGECAPGPVDEVGDRRTRRALGMDADDAAAVVAHLRGER